MKYTHLHIDACSGAAGDMLLAALINAGADLDYINAQLATLGLEHYICAWAIP